MIDIHTHIFPDNAAPRIMAGLSADSGFAPVGDGTLGSALSLLDAAGGARLVLLPVAATPHSWRGNDFSLSCAGERCLSFASLHPAEEQPEAAVRQLAQRGFVGVKLHPHYQGADIDDPRYVRLIRACAAARLPVLFHAGADPAFPQLRATPRQTARLLDQVEGTPGLVLIAAHLGGLDMFDAVEQLLVGRDIWLDTAMVGGRVSPEQYRRIIERHGWQRVLFGSDSPWQSPAAARDYLHELSLPPEQESAILHDNAARLFGLAAQA